MITVTDLKKVYTQGARQIRALDGVSLAVPAGSVHGIIGQSGAGKSPWSVAWPCWIGPPPVPSRSMAWT